MRSGISEELPSDVESSFAALRSDQLLRSALGDHLVSTYLALMEAYNKKLDHQGEVGSSGRYDWLAERL